MVRTQPGRSQQAGAYYQGPAVRGTVLLCIYDDVSGYSLPVAEWSGGALVTDTKLRLLFMTYNGWVMLAVFVGNFAGYIVFGTSTKATKETACH